MKSKNDLNHTLFEIGQVFIKKEGDYENLKFAVDRYKQLMYDLLGLDLEDERNRENLSTETGVAIGPTWAAMCLDDITRTQKFVKGIFEAVEELLSKRKDSRPIHILYAGTGPYATLILPVLASYSEKEVKVTLVEINPDSFDHVIHVFKKLGFEGYLRDALQVDATKYQFSKEIEIDIVVSETMQRALDTECQVPIYLNLQHQFGDDILFIPQQVVLSFGQSQPSSSFDSTPLFEYESLSSVFTLNNNTKRDFLNEEYSIDKESQFKKVSKNFSSQKFSDVVLPVILTEIQVFKNNWIKTNESGLTIPKIVSLDLKGLSDFTLEFHYEISDNPHLNISIAQ